MSDKPRRAWELELKIGADTREDLVSLLESLLFDSLKPGSNPEQTHDRYFEQLEGRHPAELVEALK